MSDAQSRKKTLLGVLSICKVEDGEQINLLAAIIGVEVENETSRLVEGSRLVSCWYAGRYTAGAAALSSNGDDL